MSISKGQLTSFPPPVKTGTQLRSLSRHSLWHTSSCRSDVPGSPKELVSLCWWQKSGPSQDPVRGKKRENKVKGRMEGKKKRKSQGRNKDTNSYVHIIGIFSFHCNKNSTANKYNTPALKFQTWKKQVLCSFYFFKTVIQCYSPENPQTLPGRHHLKNRRNFKILDHYITW